MSDCSTQAMGKHEIHCRSKQDCIDNGVAVPEECFRYCHGGDSSRVRFAALAELAREMYAWADGIIHKTWTIVPERVDGFREQLEELGVSVDN